MAKCDYTKTVNGHCDQQKQRGSDYCFYHDKVVQGLIEVDESAVVKGMQTMKG